MTRSLASYPPKAREEVAARRIADVEKRGAQPGWGYWAAKDYWQRLVENRWTSKDQWRRLVENKRRH